MSIITRSLFRVASSSLRSNTVAFTSIRGTNRVLFRHSHCTVATNNSLPSGSNGTVPEHREPAEPEWPRPSEVPYQPKVANSVNLIGYVNQPVQCEAASDGKFWAGTVISQRKCPDSASSPLWIPIIFQGDLAHTAACHLKENDEIFISGELFVDSPPLILLDGQTSVQVMVHRLNFIERFPSGKSDFLSARSKEGVVKHSASVGKNTNGDKMEPWRHLLANPKDWWDYRDSKQNGLIKSRHPDFKRKGDGLALWLNTAPDWAMLGLEGQVFDAPVLRKTKQKKGDESWKDLVENPDKWWDNRLDKLKERSPDFKHKETGEGLWLTDSPTWVLPKLPPIRHNEAAKAGK